MFYKIQVHCLCEHLYYSILCFANTFLRKTRLARFLDLYFREFSINFPCSNSWLKIGVNDVIFSKNTVRIEITCTTRTSVENCTNTGVKVFVLLRGNCCTISYYNFNPCGIFEKITSFSPIFNQELEQQKLLAALNSRK